MAKAPKKFALDIFGTLTAIDRHDMSYYDQLSVEEKKGFHSPVVMRWVSSATGQLADWNLMVTNERANMHHYDLYEYPDLQYRLLASVGMGAKTRHEWIKSDTAKRSSAVSEFLTRYWPSANDLEIEIILKHLREGDNLQNFLDGTGISPDEAKRVKKILE